MQARQEREARHKNKSDVMQQVREEIHKLDNQNALLQVCTTVHNCTAEDSGHGLLYLHIKLASITVLYFA